MTWLKNSSLFRSKTDSFSVLGLKAMALLVGAIAFMILLFLLLESWPAFRDIGLLPFLTDESWHPTENLYNLLPMLWGSLIASVGALLLAGPLGVLSGIYCNFYGHPKIVWWFRRCVELMAGIPSVVFGFWGLVVLVPLLSKIEAPGTSLLAGIFILALMIMPLMAMISDAAFAGVSKETVLSAEALGISKPSLVFKILLPELRPSLIAGAVLQMGRALGETMAILMVAGNIVQFPKSIFDPIRTLTTNIALEMAYAMDDHRSALFMSGVFLIVLVIVFVSLAHQIQKAPKHVS